MRCPNCKRDGIDPQAVLCQCGVHLPSLMRDMLRPGATLHGGKYRVEYALGQGGFGITYLSRHATLKKPVAIKEFYPQEQVVREATTGEIVLKTAGRDTYERALRRFMREGETLAALDHPGVVRVNDQFEEHGTAYLVMDLIDGRTLDDELNSQTGRRLPETRVREITEQLVSALDAVHAAGICHLDIKPDNILLRRDGHAVLIDFGASKQGLGTKSTRAFTLEYAAPEVLSGDDVGPQSDLYELGVVLHEMLTGERPPSALSRLTNDRWMPERLAEPWRGLVASALQLSRDARPRDVREWWKTYSAASVSSAPVQDEQQPPHAEQPSQQQTQVDSHTAPRPVSPAMPQFLSSQAGNTRRVSTKVLLLIVAGLCVLGLVAAGLTSSYSALNRIAGRNTESDGKNLDSAAGSYEPSPSMNPYRGRAFDLLPERIGGYRKARNEPFGDLERARSTLRATETYGVPYINDSTGKNLNLDVAAFTFSTAEDARRAISNTVDELKSKASSRGREVQWTVNQGTKMKDGRKVGDRWVVSINVKPVAAGRERHETLLLWNNGSALFSVSTDGGAEYSDAIEFENSFPY